MMLWELYGIRSDGRMYRAFVTETPAPRIGGYDKFVLRHLKDYLDAFLDCVPVTPPVILDGFPNHSWHDADELDVN